MKDAIGGPFGFNVSVYQLSDFEIPIMCRVIPGRREAASPESITIGRGLWIPGSPPSVAPRNEQVAQMIDFIESFHQTGLRRAKN